MIYTMDRTLHLPLKTGAITSTSKFQYPFIVSWIHSAIRSKLFTKSFRADHWQLTSAVSNCRVQQIFSFFFFFRELRHIGWGKGGYWIEETRMSSPPGCWWNEKWICNYACEMSNTLDREAIGKPDWGRSDNTLEMNRHASINVVILW